MCFGCLDKINKNRPPFCQRCSRPQYQFDSPLCKTCQKNVYHFDCIWGACFYDEIMQKLIHLFKYGQRTSLKYLFVDLMLDFMETYHIPLKSFDLLIPIPLHSTRLRERGYNQAQLIAELISKKMAIPIGEHLKRIRHTSTQTTLNQKERWTNIQGAFKIKSSIIVKDKSILLIDDLLTTGATCSEAARILKWAGAQRVSVLTLALAL